MAQDALGKVAADLYALRLGEFTAARNARAADVRGAGDRELADRIRQLKKPTASAWAVNMMARHRADELGQLLALGASLRAAQSALDAVELRELGKQRQQLIAAVVRQAGSLAQELGDPIGPAAAEEVAQTLQAALADPVAVDAVTAGLLTGPLAASGWGTVDVVGAVAVPPRKTGRATVTGIAAKQLAKAKRRLDEAEQELGRREAEAGRLEDKLEQLRPRRKELLGELEELQARTAVLQRELTSLDRECDSVGRQQEKAAAALDDAAAEVEEAAAELKRLS